MKTAKPITYKKDAKKILIHSLDARYMPKAYIEGGIAKSLQLRGHKPHMLICNGALNMCTTHFTVRKPKDKWSCNNCKSFSNNFYKITNIDYSTYEDHLKKYPSEIIDKTKSMSLDECKKFVYKDVQVGFHTKTSADRYYMGGDYLEKEYEEIFRKELENAIIATDVAENIYENQRPDVLFTTHGCYSSWGPVAEYFKNKNIRIIVWGAGYKKGTMVMDFNKFNEYFKIFYEKTRNKKLLNKEEEELINKFFVRRKSGREGETALYGFSEKESIEKYFNFDKFDKNYVIFPNVPWDASVVYAGTGFKDVYDWVSETVKLFKEKPKNQLIIKIHPSEIRVMESRKTVLDFIKEKFYPLTDNIKIIPPDTKISPYSLFPYIDTGIVFNGTIGLEMTVNGIPAVVAGSTHYGLNGFTFDSKSKEDYKNKLFNQELKLTDHQIKLAKLYAYFYFIKSFIPRDFIYQKSFLKMGWNIKSIDDLGPNKNKNLDIICDYILNNGIYQDW